MTTCPHCTLPVIEALSSSDKPILLDPTPHSNGNLALDEHGHALFLTAKQRDATNVAYVPHSARFQSHRVVCPANERTCSDDTKAFIAESDKTARQQALALPKPHTSPALGEP